jgi:hypothetical protein
MSENSRKTESLAVSTLILSIMSLAMLQSSILVYAQNESGQTTQPGQDTGEDQPIQQGAVTTEENEQGKIRCSDGSLVDRGSECPSSNECPSQPSENVTLQCIPTLQQNKANNDTNVTNASSINDVGNMSQVQEEISSVQ